MTTPGLSLKATFENPRYKADTFDGAAAALGTKGRQKFAMPYIAVDGVEHAGEWGPPTYVEIAPGSHKIEVYFKFKGLPVKRAKGKADFTGSDGEIAVHAHFGQYIVTTEVQVPGQALIRKKRLYF
jgi:hypothetical protein